MNNMEIKINEEIMHPATPDDLLNKVKTFEKEEDLQPIINILEKSSPKFLDDTLMFANEECKGKNLAPLARDLYGILRKTIRRIGRARAEELLPSDQRFLQGGKFPHGYIEKRTKKNFTGK